MSFRLLKGSRSGNLLSRGDDGSQGATKRVPQPVRGRPTVRKSFPVSGSNLAGGSKGSAGNRILSRLVSDRGRPGGQVLVQRPAPQATSNAKETSMHSTAGVERKNDLNGVIAMEEVLKDLNILEEQQREAQRKLKAAKDNKQRSQQRHTTVETQLGELKFKGGQIRATLQQMRGVLATSQRDASMMRVGVEEADGDLHKFNRQLKQVLRTKQMALESNSKQETQYQRLQVRIEKLRLRSQETKDKREESERALDLMDEQRQKLDDRLKEELVSQSKIVSMIAETGKAIESLQEEEKENIIVEADAESALKQASKKEEESQMFQEKSIKDLNIALDESEHEVRLLGQNLVNAESAMKSKRGELLDLWNRHLNDREKKEIPPILAQSKKLDATSFSLALKAEEHSLDEETRASVGKESELRSLKSQLKLLQSETESVLRNTARMKFDLDKLVSTETIREKNFHDVLQSLGQVKMENETLFHQVTNLTATRERQKVDAREKRLSLRRNVDMLERELDDKNNASELLESKFLTGMKSFHVVENAHDNDLQNLNDKLRKIEDEMSENQQHVTEIDEPTFIAEVDRMKEQIAKFLEVHPILDQVVVTYDHSKTAEEQALLDLEPVTRDCKKREDSARKAREELELASERERIEREKLEKAEAEESRRKDLARQRRQQRLDADSKHTTKEAKQTKRSKHQRQDKKRLPKKRSHEQMSAAKPRNLLQNFSQVDDEAIHTDGLISSPADPPKEQSQLKKKVRWSREEDVAGEVMRNVHEAIQGTSHSESQNQSRKLNTNKMESVSSHRQQQHSAKSKSFKSSHAGNSNDTKSRGGPSSLKQSGDQHATTKQKYHERNMDISKTVEAKDLDDRGVEENRRASFLNMANAKPTKNIDNHPSQRELRDDGKLHRTNKDHHEKLHRTKKDYSTKATVTSGKVRDGKRETFKLNDDEKLHRTMNKDHSTKPNTKDKVRDRKHDTSKLRDDEKLRRTMNKDHSTKVSANKVHDRKSTLKDVENKKSTNGELSSSSNDHKPAKSSHAGEHQLPHDNKRPSSHSTKQILKTRGEQIAAGEKKKESSKSTSRHEQKRTSAPSRAKKTNAEGKVTAKGSERRAAAEKTEESSKSTLRQLQKNQASAQSRAKATNSEGKVSVKGSGQLAAAEKKKQSSKSTLVRCEQNQTSAPSRAKKINPEEKVPEAGSKSKESVVKEKKKKRTNDESTSAQPSSTANSEIFVKSKKRKLSTKTETSQSTEFHGENDAGIVSQANTTTLVTKKEKRAQKPVNKGNQSVDHLLKSKRGRRTGKMAGRRGGPDSFLDDPFDFA